MNAAKSEIVIPEKKRLPLPFVSLREGQDPSLPKSWDGWRVEKSGDDKKDYDIGKHFAELAIKEAIAINDLAPITFTMATIYAKAHLTGVGDGAMERGFVDGIGRYACKGYRRRFK